MSENSPIVPAHKPGDETEHVVIGSPAMAELERLRADLEREDMGVTAKIQLARMYARAVAAANKNRIQAALRTAEPKKRAAERTASGAITLYEEKAMLDMSGVFIDVMRTMGMQINLGQLDFLREFSEKIAALEEQIEKSKTADKLKESILESSNSIYNDICDKLDRLTGVLIKQATELRRNDDAFWAQHDPAVEETYAGQWVVPFERRIVAHGADVDAVLEEAARVTQRSKNELLACAIPHPDDWLVDV